MSGYEATEVACDGADNDCDGTTDEGCDPLSVGLIGHWKLDGDGQDSGPFADHGTVFGAVPTTDRFGRAGMAMRFSADDDRVEVPATEHPTGEVTATYSLWVRADRGSSVVNQAYFSFGDALEVNRRSSLVRMAGRGCARYVGEQNDTGYSVCAPEGHWSHVAVVKAGREVRFYFNGRLIETAMTEAGQDLTGTSLVIGLSKVREGGPYEQFHGALDDLRVWGRALSADEIMRLATADDMPAVGSQARPGQSCLHVKASTGSTTDGLAWLDLDGDGPGQPLQLWCDQTTDGGGWALVWVYEFTNFTSFQANDNAITPRPSWPVGQAQVPVSTTPPTSPTTLGALDWSLWRELGASFSVRSDLADHIACDPGRGSLVHGTSGWVSCRMVQDVTATCDGVLPRELFFGGYGPALRADDLYFYFDGNLEDNWPTHDPCGQNKPQHVASPSRAGGAVWVRPTDQPVEWPRECNEVSGILRANGTRRIDPDGPGGRPSFTTECRFDVERGGWTRLSGAVLDTLNQEPTAREFLYTRGKDFYRSPVTNIAWDPKGFAELTGLWWHEKAGVGAGVFQCSGGATGEVGVGCGPIPGGIASGSLPRVLPQSFDAVTGTATVCQAPVDVFATGVEACSSDVAIWVRNHYCMPDEGSLIGDGGFDELAAATEPWESPCWGAYGPGGFKDGFTLDATEVRPGGKAPSLRVNNPEVGNLIYAYGVSQRRFSVVAGRSYTLGFWAKAAAPRSMRVFVQPTSYDYAVFYEDVMVDTQWRYFSLGFEARRTLWSVTLDFQLAESSTAALWLDDVSLSEDGPSPCGPTTGNVFGNGDFSRGRTCWRAGNNYTGRLAGMRVEPAGGPSGGPRAVVELRGQPGEAWWATVYRQNVALERGRRYRLHVTARADVPRQMYLNLNRWDLGAEPWFNTEQPISTAWRTYTHDFVAKSDTPSDGATFEMAFGEGPAGWVELADIRLEPLGFDACAVDEGEVLADPTFAQGLSCWPFEWHWNELDLYAEYDPGRDAVRAEISSNAGGFDYTARITQRPMTLVDGHGYVLKWRSEAQSDRRGYTNIQDWPTLYMNQPVLFEPRAKEHEVPWVQVGNTSTAKLEIGFGGPLATGSTWFSGLQVLDLGAAPCARAAGDRFANGDFGMSYVCWDLARDWDAVRFEALSDSTTFGLAPPSIRLDYGVRTQPQNVAFTQRGFSFVPGEHYTVTFMARASGNPSGSIFLAVFDEVGGGQGGLSLEVGPNWQQYSVGFTAVGTAAGRGVIEIQLNGLTDPLTLWVDDFSLTTRQPR